MAQNYYQKSDMHEIDQTKKGETEDYEYAVLESNTKKPSRLRWALIGVLFIIGCQVSGFVGYQLSSRSWNCDCEEPRTTSPLNVSVVRQVRALSDSTAPVPPGLLDSCANLFRCENNADSRKGYPLLFAMDDSTTVLDRSRCSYRWSASVDNNCAVNHAQPLNVNIRQSGVHLLSVVPERNTGDQCNVTLKGLSTTIGYSHGSTAGTWWRASGRNVMLNVTSGTSLSATTAGRSCKVDGLSGLSLSHTMKSSLVAFHFATTTKSDKIGEIELPLQLVNTRSGSFTSVGTFKCTESGTYWLGYSVGMVAYNPLTVTLRRNGYIIQSSSSDFTEHNGVRMLSGATVVNLNQNDEIYLSLDSGKVYSSIEYKETSLMGFLYNPKGKRVVFSTGNYQTPHGQQGAFAGATITENIMTTDHDSSLVVPETGLYYLHLSVSMSGYSSESVEMSVYAGGEKLPNVRLYNWNTERYDDNLSGGYIVPLEKGKKLTVISRGRQYEKPMGFYLMLMSN